MILLNRFTNGLNESERFCVSNAPNEYTVYRVSFIVTREAKGYFYNQTTEMLHVKHKRMKKVGLINIILFKT